MLQLKKTMLIIVSAVLASLLVGCAASPPQRTTVARREPVSTPREPEAIQEVTQTSPQAEKTVAVEELQQIQQSLPPSLEPDVTSPEESFPVPPLPPDTKAPELEETLELQAEFTAMEFVQQRIYGLKF